jgi:DNA polymerase-3 subunit gamma/tau
VFENIIAQPAADQLKADILSNRLAPSMLFFGPPASGKGSAAMELARVLSCEKNTAAWNCACSSCVRHRSLMHPDLAMIGPRSFSADASASRAAFLRDSASAAGRSLFIRSVRKLLARFAPTVWEYESRSGKVNPLPLLQSLEEDLDELERASGLPPEKSEKITDAIIKNAIKLEDECISDTVSIAQIRKAAYWCHLSPTGKRKTLIIENSDRMKNEARNSLLKLLEEPPESLCIVLTVQRRETMLQTILSRLRPYRFVSRSADQEREIIRRIFRDSQVSAAGNVSENAAPSLVDAYISSYMPQPPEKLLPLAAFFVAAIARSAAAFTKKRGLHEIPLPLAALGGYCAPLAEAAGFERTSEAKETIAALLAQSKNFEGRSFVSFLSLSLDLVSKSLERCAPNPGLVSYLNIWKKQIGDAQSAYSVWNQRPELALETLFFRLREELACAGMTAT